MSQAFPQRVVATAARAWRALSRENFERHVLIFVREPVDDHPTILFKMTPWSHEEVAQLREFFAAPSVSEPWSYRVLQDPLYPEEGLLAPAFFSGANEGAFFDALPLRLDAVSDDRPFYHFVRKSLDPVEVDLSSFVDSSTVHIVERRRIGGMVIPRDLIHLFMSSAACLLAGLLVVAVPLRRSSAGQIGWPGRLWHLLYFGCLGMGFIIFELGAIQSAMRVIGFPVYGFTAIIATFLGFGGLGSAWAGRWLERAGDSRRDPAHLRGHLGWLVSLLVVAALTVGFRGPWGDLWIGRDLAWRVLGTVIGTAPLAFLLGMPMPLGMAWLRAAPRGAVSWAWAVNSVATVSGGVVMILAALHWGISATLWLGVGTYALALGCIARSGRSRPS